MAVREIDPDATQTKDEREATRSVRLESMEHSCVYYFDVGGRWEAYHDQTQLHGFFRSECHSMSSYEIDIDGSNLRKVFYTPPIHPHVDDADFIAALKKSMHEDLYRGSIDLQKVAVLHFVDKRSSLVSSADQTGRSNNVVAHGSRRHTAKANVALKVTEDASKVPSFQPRSKKVFVLLIRGDRFLIARLCIIYDLLHNISFSAL